MNDLPAPDLPHTDERPTHVRYLVLAVLCSLAFLTYLDRICIMRVQEDIARDLGFDRLTEANRRELESAAAVDYAPLLKKEDEEALRAAGALDDPEARRAAAEKRLRANLVNERLGWVFFAFLLGYTLFEIPGGWLGDVWGPRIVIVRIVVWWSVFTALTGSADTVVGWFVTSPSPVLLVAALVLVRFLFGLGEAGAYPNISRSLARWFPYRERARAQGGIWMASRLGGAFSPLIIGLLITGLQSVHRDLGWREAFFLLGGVGVVWAALFGVWFRNRPEEKPSVNAAERALIRAQDAGAGSVYDDHHRGGIPWRRALLSANLWAISVTAAAVSFSWYINVTFFPKYLKEKFGVSFENSELMSGLPLFVSAFFCLLGGGLSDVLVRWTGSKRWGRSLPGLIGFSAAGVAFLFIPQAINAWTAVALVCIACALQDLAIPCIWSVCADVGGRYAGTLSGCMNAAGGVGAMLSPLVASRLANAFDWNVAFLVFAGSYFLGALMWLRIDATESIMTAPADPSAHA
jgi:MFS family permease